MIELKERIKSWISAAEESYTRWDIEDKNNGNRRGLDYNQGFKNAVDNLKILIEDYK